MVARWGGGGHLIDRIPPSPGRGRRQPAATADAGLAPAREIQSRRWATALRVESRAGVAVCESDPLKLHNVWSRWQLGHAERAHFEREAAAARQRLVLGRLGFADVVVVARTDEATARANARRDGSRSRSGFELHVQLGEPLRRWYATLDELSPGHVVWSLPEAGLLALPRRLRVIRSDMDLFDRFVARLLE
jgi:hypothetical protein